MYLLGLLPPILDFRMLWVTGRFGSGKTAFAYSFARYLSRRYSYQVVSNVTGDGMFVPDAPFEMREHTVILLDEAADVVDAYSRPGLERSNVFSYLRHLDIILLMTSSILIVKRLRRLVCSPIMRFGPVWAYRWWFGPDSEVKKETDVYPFLGLQNRFTFAYDSYYRYQYQASCFILDAMDAFLRVSTARGTRKHTFPARSS